MTPTLAGERNFAYDDENELISVWQTNVWREDYVYDGKLRRRITRQFTWNGSGWQLTNEVHYVYDGNVVIQERDQNNLPVVTYTRGVDLSGSLQGAGDIGGLLARTDMGRLTVNDPLATAYYHADGNGNITALITGLMDTNQVLVAKYLYDPYGNLLAESGPLASANKYRFSSKEWNDNASLYYYGFRFYDPNLQRWLNRDPVQDANLFEWVSAYLFGIPIGSSISQGDHPQGGINANAFAFVANSPLFWADMLGLDLGPVNLWPIIPPKQSKPPWMPPYSIGPVDLDPFKRNPSLTCHFGGGWTGTVSGNPIKGGINGTLSGPILGGTLTISGGNNGGKGGWNAGGSLTWTW